MLEDGRKIPSSSIHMFKFGAGTLELVGGQATGAREHRRAYGGDEVAYLVADMLLPVRRGG